MMSRQTNTNFDVRAELLQCLPIYPIQYLIVNISVPHIVYCAASAPHDKGSDGKGGEEVEVRKLARAGGHADAGESEKVNLCGYKDMISVDYLQPQGQKSSHVPIGLSSLASLR